MLLCLGLDYRRGGFVDRAIEAFTEVLRLDPQNRYALSNLEKLHEEQHQWEEAYVTRQRLAALDGRPTRRAAAATTILAFLENELGQAALRARGLREAARRFEAAIDLDARDVPAHLHLGDVRCSQGATPRRPARGSG